MKTKFSFKNLEIGQVIPIVAFALIVIIIMAALLIDGGSLMVNRRTAQAAADAGALAGAQQLCIGDLDPVETAITYAMVNNSATTASATLAGKTITVLTTVEHSSFFARILGETSLNASAEAVAGCFPPSISVHPIPIAFYYESPPITAEGADCKDDGTCNLVAWDLFELLDTLSKTKVEDLPLDYIYIVSDNTRICYQDTTGDVICSEIKKDSGGGGSRTWIDLTPLKTSGAQNLASVIRDGLDEPLYVDPKIWVNSEEGTVTAGYKAIFDLDPILGYEDVNARLTYVPLFDKFCGTNQTPVSVNCAEPEDIYIKGFKDNNRAYRLEGYAAFLVTCVTSNNKCEDGDCLPKSDPRNNTNHPQCPGYITADPTAGDVNALEGYFVIGFDPDAFGAGGADGGLYIISLLK